MIGFRGCGRYTDPFFEECFAMELEVPWMDEGLGGLVMFGFGVVCSSFCGFWKRSVNVLKDVLFWGFYTSKWSSEDGFCWCLGRFIEGFALLWWCWSTKRRSLFDAGRPGQWAA